MSGPLRSAARVLPAAAVFVATCPEPGMPFLAGLDPSWVWLVNTLPSNAWAKLCFTYGPLGWLIAPGQGHVLTAALVRAALQLSSSSGSRRRRGWATPWSAPPA